MVAFILKLNATSYYVSSTGSDTNNGTSTATPWKTISKVNASAFVSGDLILFKSGDTFYGTLSPSVSGITYGNYGTGAKPIITGLTAISSWTSLGGNIWVLLYQEVCLH